MRPPFHCNPTMCSVVQIVVASMGICMCVYMYVCVLLPLSWFDVAAETLGMFRMVCIVRIAGGELLGSLNPADVIWFGSLNPADVYRVQWSCWTDCSNKHLTEY